MFQLLILSLSLSYNCPNISTITNLNLTEYIRLPWYIQLQQETPYLPINSNYCVSARYSISNKTVPFYNGTVLNVFNQARLNNVSGTPLNYKNTSLCKNKW